LIAVTARDNWTESPAPTVTPQKGFSRDPEPRQTPQRVEFSPAITMPAINITMPEVQVHMPAQSPPNVTVAAPNVTVSAPSVTVDARMPDMPAPVVNFSPRIDVRPADVQIPARRTDTTIHRDGRGEITGTTQIERDV
jgi:hypothetical protein